MIIIKKNTGKVVYNRTNNYNKIFEIKNILKLSSYMGFYSHDFF